MSTRPRPSRPDRAPERLISALLPDITAQRPAPPPVSLPALPAPAPAGIDDLSSEDPDRVLLGIAHLDRSGRFHERLLLRALGWAPGRELDLDSSRGTVVIVAAVGGAHRVDHRGAIALPAAARRMSGIPIGPPVLLVADMRRRRLVVHPAAAVVRLLSDYDCVRARAEDDR
jgi:bifunctional DNA-binding transcriptional regulator/antitoxin component of YhaV-PrlF toxin-antitoxin module